MLAHFILAAAAAVLVPFTSAAPTVVYQPMTQQPPVARVGQSFIFNLLPNTFNSSTATLTSPINYTSSSLPSWMSFDSAVLTFYGTPPASDAGNQYDITITATDSTGSVNANWTCIVTNYSSPSVHRSFISQIADPSIRQFSSVTAMPNNTGIAVPPYWSFSLGWAGDTFRQPYTNGNGKLYLQAHVRDMAGLPSWLSFSNTTNTFSGVAPAAGGSYTVIVTGTDFWGYTGAQMSFVIEVGQGETIEAVGNWTAVNTISSAQISKVLDPTIFTIEGQNATATDLELSIDTTNFPWLSFDSTTNTVSGRTPNFLQNGTITSLSLPVTARPTNTSNTVSVTTWLSINVQPYMFTTFNLNSTATPAQEFSYNIQPYLVNKTATVNATVSPQAAASWLTFYPSNLTILGTPPKNVTYNAVDVTFAASLGGYTSLMQLGISLLGVTASGTNATGSAPVPNGSASGGGLSTAGKIALGVVLGLFLLILLLLLLICCCRRRKQRSEEDKEGPENKDLKDDASFIAASPLPANDPFKPQNGHGIANILLAGGLALRVSQDNGMSPRASSFESGGTGAAVAVAAVDSKPTRLDGLKSIFGWKGEKPTDPVITNGSASFIGDGEIIEPVDDVDVELDGVSEESASSFTQSCESRASWESRDTFHWSSAEGSGSPTGDPNRLSTVPSIPRPRPNFTPRYPRSQSPNELARLAPAPSMTHSSFSEFRDSRILNRDRSSFTASGSELMSIGTSSTFPSGPTGLDRFAGSANGFPSVRSIQEEDDISSLEGPAVVAVAERQSFEMRRPSERRTTPRLRPSRERVNTGDISSPGVEPHTASQTALALGSDGVFDDADEHRRSTYAPSEVNGLGYPASEIFFGSQGHGDPSSRLSFDPSEAGVGSVGLRTSTIRTVPSTDNNPVSPPLPQVGTMRNVVSPASRPSSGIGDGRVVACANETFSIHPTLNPPPTVSLSAATWSSTPPSTYRAATDSGQALPSWLHFDSRELELWGVPKMDDAGQVTVVRIIEKLPSNNRRSDPMAFGYQPPQEREVGRVVIEVIDRLRSPQFELDDGAHAF